MRPRLLLGWLIFAAVMLATVRAPPMGQGALWRFLSQDVIPPPAPGRPAALLPWLWELTTTAILPGLAATLIVAQLALVLAGSWPLSRRPRSCRA
ncbi:hypothetical protein FLP41_01705 (plasmid) [Paracoccus marcusii]|uniref:hypothetical protein n=1 Tax=Paracoccus marcusii TaxID=59779 RepID=UPI002ED4B92F|nr:hypothetical protein FLP41_01705 [Paracoccus marcusii]